MSGCGSAHYTLWCLDDRIFSPQYETVTPTQVLSGHLRQGLMGKRNWKYGVKLWQRDMRQRNKSTLLFSNLCWEAEIYLSSQSTPGFAQYFPVHKRNRLWRNDVCDEWFPFEKFLKDVLYLLKRCCKGIWSLFCCSIMTTVWKNGFRLRRVWDKNLGRIFYLSHFLCSSTTNIAVWYFVRKCLVVVQ